MIGTFIVNDVQILLGPDFTYERVESKARYMSAALKQKNILTRTRQSIHGLLIRKAISKVNPRIINKETSSSRGIYSIHCEKNSAKKNARILEK
jgi:hypothetical protein